MPTWNWKQGDLAPSMLDTLLDGNGVAVDTTTATSVKLVAKNVLTNAVVINAAAVFVNQGPGGQVRYDPIAADTTNPQLLRADWQVTWGTGKVETFPVRRGNDERLISIAPKIA